MLCIQHKDSKRLNQGFKIIDLFFLFVFFLAQKNLVHIIHLECVKEVSNLLDCDLAIIFHCEFRKAKLEINLREIFLFAV